MPGFVLARLCALFPVQNKFFAFGINAETLPNECHKDSVPGSGLSTFHSQDLALV